MDIRHVLAIGLLDKSNRSGLFADQKVLEKLNIFTTLAISGITATDPLKDIWHEDGYLDVLQNGLDASCNDANVFKIGALCSERSILVVADAHQESQDALVVVDAEAMFKREHPAPLSVIRSFREKLLPIATVLTATVPEAKLLLDNAGINVDYPQNMKDVENIGNLVQSLGPKYVLIKREIFDEVAQTTSFYSILCGSDDPIVAASTFANPACVTGLSYSIPSAIAANLANGLDVPQATLAALKFIEDMLLDGTFFNQSSVIGVTRVPSDVVI